MSNAKALPLLDHGRLILEGTPLSLIARKERQLEDSPTLGVSEGGRSNGPGGDYEKAGCLS